MNPRVCCCGCARWEHAKGGAGPCRRCRSCDRFHDVGEGHRVGRVLFGLLVLAVLLAAVWMLAGCDSRPRAMEVCHAVQCCYNDVCVNRGDMLEVPR